MKRIVIVTIVGILVIGLVCVVAAYQLLNPSSVAHATPTVALQPTPYPLPPIIVEVTVIPPSVVAQPPNVVVQIPLILKSEAEVEVIETMPIIIPPSLGSDTDPCAGLSGKIAGFVSNPFLINNSLWVVQCLLQYAFSDQMTAVVFRGQAGELLIAKCHDPVEKIPPKGTVCIYDAFSNYLCKDSEYQRFVPWQWY